MRISVPNFTISLVLALFISNTSFGQNYCSAGPSSSADSDLDEVELKGSSITLKNNTASGCATYNDFTGMNAPDLYAGLEYEISITAGTCGSFQYTKGANAWIDYNKNGIFEHPDEALLGPNGHGGPSSSAWTQKFKFKVPLTASNGKTRMRVMVVETSGAVNNPCATYNWGGVEDYSVDIRVEFDNDAGISNLMSPGIPVCAALTSTFTPEIKNFGLKDLDSCIVNWMVNDSLLAPFKYRGKLTNRQTGTASSTFYRNFVLGDTIKAWTTSPNGIPDSLPLNDTLVYVVIDGLSGSYTVGGALADFDNIDSAIIAVNRQGVCGHVVFELNNGSHIPTVALNHFNGSSVNGTLTFTSVANDRTMAFITDTSTSNANNFAMILDGASWINFKEVTLSNGGSGTYAGVVKIVNSANNIDFTDCDFFSSYTGTSINGTLIFGDEVISNNLTISNCNLTNGSRALAFLGKQGKESDGITIEENVFTNQTLSALDVTFVKNLTIERNMVSSTSSNNNGVAFRIDETLEDVAIMNNVITGNSNWPISAVYISNSKGNRNSDRDMVNNIFAIGDTSASLDYLNVVLEESEFWNIAHNTIVIQGGSTDAVGLSVDGGTGNEVHNNLVTVFGDGQTLMYEQSGSVAGSDGNNLYTEKGSNFATYLGSASISLIDWQTSTGNDANKSTVGDPLYYDRYNGDFRICSSVADNIGLPLGIARDFANSSRDPLTPDPGAFEFASIQGFSVNDQSICDGDTAMFTAVAGANDTIMWNGTLVSNSYSTTQAGPNTVRAYGFCGSVTDTFYVRINAPVQLQNDHNLCYGEDTVVGGNLPKASYMWNNGARTQNITVKATGQYYVSVVDTDGCMSADTINITISGKAMLGPDVTVCKGQVVTLDPGTGSGNYTWTWNGATQPSASKFYADSAGTYAVSYSDQFNCSSTDTMMITHWDTPSAEFSMTPRNAISQNNFEFIADYKQGTNYHWSFGDGKSVNGPAWQTVNAYSQNGSYTVILTVSSVNCGDSTFSKTLEIEGVGVTEQASIAGLKVYPNPNNGTFSINFGELAGKVVNVSVKAVDGKVIFNESNSGTPVQSFEVGNISTGLYLLEIAEGQKVVYQGKLSIQK